MIVPDFGGQERDRRESFSREEVVFMLANTVSEMGVPESHRRWEAEQIIRGYEQSAAARLLSTTFANTAARR